MKNLQFNPYQCRAMWVGSKKFKPIPALPRDAGLKSHPISFPSQTLLERDKIVISMIHDTRNLKINIMKVGFTSQK